MHHAFKLCFYGKTLAALMLILNAISDKAEAETLQPRVKVVKANAIITEVVMPGTITLEFSNLKHFKQVRLIHDTVMGGRSNGLLTVLSDPAGLRFNGNLSLANNGGFASVEFNLAQALSTAEFKTLNLKALADGRKYQLRLKTPFIPQGVSYVAEFQSSKQLQRYQFEPVDFRGQFRGRQVSNLPVLNYSDVSHVSLMLADSNQGPFVIELFSIQFSALQTI